MLRIPLDIGRAYIQLRMETATGGKEFVPFKFDTGADFTTISKTSLEKLGYDAEWLQQNATIVKKGVTTATGQVVDLYVVKLSVINLFHYSLKKFPIRVGVGADFRNLIGLDIINAFDWLYSSSSKHLVLQQFVGLNKKLFEQDVTGIYRDVEIDEMNIPDTQA